LKTDWFFVTPKVILYGTIWGLLNLINGLWFLFTHPILFMKFSNEYRMFQESIDANDELARGGYYSLNRRERRKLHKAVR
jgi:hypothetical protein